MLFSLSYPVYADDTLFNIQYGASDYSEYYYLNNLPFEDVGVFSASSSIMTELATLSCSTREDCYNSAINYFQNSSFSHYSIYLQFYPVGDPSPYITMQLVLFNDISSYEQTIFVPNRFSFKDSNNFDVYYAIVLDGWSDPNYNNFYMFYDSNFNFINNSGDFIFSGFYDNENSDYNNMIHAYNGETMPKIKDLLQYSSWSDYTQNHISNYSEVNLDNYEYILLSLKNYSNVQAFQSDFYVKGSIGITPIYNYGQSSKDSVTGSQVQDRCNISYSSYTALPFYITQTDIQNNSIYAVKSCSSGSSFKYDSSIFDITYVTPSNVYNPTITINGKTYNVIPYDDLPSTATGNEESNYIPGESGSATDTGGLDSAIKGARDTFSGLWNTFTYFTDFIGQLFSSLPSELSSVLLTCFTVALVIGLLKIFVL